MIGIIGGEKTIELLESRMAVDGPEIIKGMKLHSGRLNQTGASIMSCDRDRMAEAAEVLLNRFEMDRLIQIDLATPLVPYLQHGDMVIAEYLFQFPTKPPTRDSDSQQIPIIMQEIGGDLVLAQKIKDIYDINFAGISNRPELIIGTVVSNNTELSDKRVIAALQRDFGAVAMDYEGAAVARLCQKKECSFLGLRAVTESMTYESRMNADPTLSSAIENLLLLIERVVATPELTTVV